MWNSIIIGKGDRGSVATKLSNKSLGENHGISQNSVSYWISGCILNAGITVFKNTAEGEEITDFIESGGDAQEVYRCINKIILKHMDIDTFEMLLYRYTDKVYTDGKRDTQVQIQIALGIY
jgi:hypothetical protein